MDLALLNALNLIETSIQSEEPLQQGHRLKISFTASKGKWTRATQIAIIEWRLESHKDFRIISANYWGENYVSFEVEVMDTAALLSEKKIIEYILAANPKGFTLILVPKIKSAAGTVVNVAKEVAVPAVGVGMVVLIIAGMYFYKKLR